MKKQLKLEEERKEREKLKKYKIIRRKEKN